MRKLLAILMLTAAVFMPAAQAGDAGSGSVPLIINYQGRLEQNNAPVNGTVPMVFKIKDAKDGGTVLWTSPEISVEVTEGIFGAAFQPPLSVIGMSGEKFLQIMVDNDTLNPAEQIHSVPYAYVAKALADGSNITVSTSVATFSYVEGSLKAKQLYIDGQLWTSPTQTSVASVYASTNASFGVDAPAPGNTDNGHLAFFVGQYSNGKIGAFYPNGNLLLGGSATAFETVAPQHRLMVQGDIAQFDSSASSAYFGLLHKTGVTVMPSYRYAVTDGQFRVMPATSATDSSYKSTLSLYSFATSAAEENPTSYTRGVFEMTGSTLTLRTESTGQGVPVSLETVGLSRIFISTAGQITNSYGTRSAWVYFSSDVYTQSGLRSGDVVVGSYGGYAAGVNPISNIGEIMSPQGALVIQASTGSSVGVGISTPDASMKLHVSGKAYFENALTVGKTNSAENLTINSSNTFINGNLSAYAQGRDNRVELPTTTIHGSLDVSDSITVNGRTGAFLASTQTFSGKNTFSNPVYVTSNVFTLGYSTVPSVETANGLFVVGGLNTTDSARMSLVAGRGYGSVDPTANSELYFYRGSTEAARFVTEGGSNMSLYVNKVQRAAFDSSGNIALTLSTATATQLSVIGGGLLVKQHPSAAAPALLVNASDGRVAIGTTTLGANSQMTVSGAVRLMGSGSGIYFEDNSFLTSASAVQATAQSVSNSTNAVVTAGAVDGIGSVILQVGASKADMVIRNKVGSAGVGNVGIGTDDPADRLHIEVGSLRVGSRSLLNPFGGNSAIVENGLLVSQSAYLATASGAVGVGTTSPGIFKLAVAGDVNTTGGLYGNGTLRLTAAGALRNISGLEFAGAGPYTITSDNNVINVNPGSGYLNLLSGLYMNGTEVITTNRFIQNVNAYNQTAGTFVSSASTSMELSALTSFKLSAPNFNVGTDGKIQGKAASASALELTGAGAGINFSGTGTKQITAANDLNIVTGGTTAVTGYLTATNPVGVPSGGTGLNSITSYGVIYGNGTANVGVTAAGTSNYLLQGNGSAAPSWVQSTDAATGNTIVRRDGAGSASFDTLTATTINAEINGNSKTATNLAQGHIGEIPYQTSPGNTAFLSVPSAGTPSLLYEPGGNSAPSWLPVSNTANSSVVLRDGSGNFTAGTITASLSGNATTATSATSATTATNIAGGANGSLPYQTSAGATSLLAAPGSASVLYSAGAAPSWRVVATASTANSIVMRDASGNFSAGTITASLNGNATTATSATSATSATTATSATRATNLAGGGASQVPYQTSSGNTAFTGTPDSGERVLYSDGGDAPIWKAATSSSGPGNIVIRDSVGVGGIEVQNLDALGTVSATGGFSAAGSAGIDATITVVTDAAGTTCRSLVFKKGILTSNTSVACP